jgi:hypothetical protein
VHLLSPAVMSKLVSFVQLLVLVTRDTTFYFKSGTDCHSMETVLLASHSGLLV